MQEQTIFTEALEKEDSAERAAFLEGACAGDARLRQRVERLLGRHDHAGSFLEQLVLPGDATADYQPPISEQPGAVIGPYKLLEQIGEGGMGVVFMAEQEKPVRRRVALKIIKPGMDTRAVVARFEAERQALALMDHPNIAKVLDAGTTGDDRGQESGVRSQKAASTSTPDPRLLTPAPALQPPASSLPSPASRPYFVMDLVHGVPITDYCDQCQLPTKERLELFISVCQAVQHAHQKGIIHRDLKPTNVLVAIQDGQPTPKIIDFGVAKAIGEQRLTERTLTTDFAQMIGTPLYMSPEQAELSPLGVDTRSDIYSLGVILYELLTGATPFDKDRLQEASYDELRRIIREEEPPRPSARLSSLSLRERAGVRETAKLADTIAEKRRTDPRRLIQSVRGELDWIVMKCLEKDRNRRYETAGSLARDVERYLNDEPVQACPPSIAYRLKKLVRRNKAAAAIVALLFIGVASLAVSNVQIKRERDAKTTALARANAISGLLQDMLASSNPDQVKGSKYTVRQQLDDFSAGLGDQLTSEPEVEAAIRSVIGKSYWRLGVYDRAELHLKKALDLNRRAFGPEDERVADSLVDYAWSVAEQSRYAEAEPCVREALSIYETRNSNPRATVRALWSLQNFLSRPPRLAEAEQAADKALALAGDEDRSDFAELPNILHDLAGTKLGQGQYKESEILARRAVKIHRRLHGDHHPETAWGLYNLGRALKQLHQFDDADAALRESLAIFREYYTSEHQSIQGVSQELKAVLEAQGDRSGLEALTKEEAELATRSNTPDNFVRQAGLLLTYDPTKSQKEEARRLIGRAVEEYGKVAIDYPGDLDRRVKALNGYVQAIGHCAAAKDFDGEVDQLNRLLEAELPKLLAAFPDSSECQWQTSSVYRNWAVQLIPYSEYLSEAERALREAIELLEKLAQSDSKRPGVWLYLADRNIVLGYLCWLTDRPQDAEAAYGRAIEIYDQHQAEETATDSNSSFAPVSYMDSVWLAYYLGCTHREDKAAAFIRNAAFNAKRVTTPSESSAALCWTALAQIRLGDDGGYRKTCKALVDGSIEDSTKAVTVLTWCLAPDAIEDLSLPVTLAEELAGHNSIDPPHIVPFVLGAALYRAGQYERAAVELEESIVLYPSDPRLGDRIINWQRLFLAMTQWRLGQRDEARQLVAEIRPAIDEELKSLSTPFNYRLMLEVYRREAESLIKPNEDN